MTAGVRVWGDGPRPVVLLHCSLAQASAWKGVAAALPQGFHLIAPDIVGHGAGPAYDPTRDLHDQCFDAILPHLPEGRFDVVGHSFGGTLALRVAIEMPERMRSLTMFEPVLFAAAQGSGLFSRHIAASTAFGQAMAANDAVRATKEFLKLWGTGASLDEIPDAQREYMIDRIPLIHASEPALFDDSAALLPRMASVHAPTLLMAGQACQPVVTAILDRVAADIPHTSRVSIQGAGHMAPITHPGPVAQAIATHLIGITP